MISARKGALTFFRNLKKENNSQETARILREGITGAREERDGNRSCVPGKAISRS